MRTITQSATAATVQEAAHQLLVLDYPRAVVDLPDRMRALIDQRLEMRRHAPGDGLWGVEIYHAAAVLVEGDDEVGSRAVIELPDGWGEAEVVRTVAACVREVQRARIIHAMRAMREQERVARHRLAVAQGWRRRLVAWAEAQGMTQQEVADTLGLTKQRIGQLLRQSAPWPASAESSPLWPAGWSLADGMPPLPDESACDEAMRALAELDERRRLAEGR